MCLHTELYFPCKPLLNGLTQACVLTHDLHCLHAKFVWNEQLLSELVEGKRTARGYDYEGLLLMLRYGGRSGLQGKEPISCAQMLHLYRPNQIPSQSNCLCSNGTQEVQTCTALYMAQQSGSAFKRCDPFGPFGQDYEFVSV